jgi:hypothetical protein
MSAARTLVFRAERWAVGFVGEDERGAIECVGLRFILPGALLTELSFRRGPP